MEAQHLYLPFYWGFGFGGSERLLAVKHAGPIQVPKLLK